MKAAGIVILFPLISVVIVSLYVQGGASRIVALLLLAIGLLGIVAATVRKRTPRQDT